MAPKRKYGLGTNGFFIFLLLIALSLSLFFNLILWHLNNEQKNKEFDHTINKQKSSYQVNELEKCKKELNKSKKLIKELNGIIKNSSSFNANNLKVNLRDLNKKFFEENYELRDDVQEYKLIIEEIKKYCKRDNKLNLLCVINILKNDLTFKYISESDDNIKSIDEFVKDKGGDCEDWSLFIKALINYFRKNEDIYYLIYGKEKKGVNSTIYIKNNTKYYLKDIKSENLDLLDKEIYIFCYTITNTSGHCQIAFDKPIKSFKDLFKLKSIIIEPQNGISEGNIYAHYDKKLKIEKEYKNKKHDVFIILSNHNIFTKEWDLWLSS